jgi:energy-coupling factor transporter ATP-binding protein EcfA2
MMGNPGAAITNALTRLGEELERLEMGLEVADAPEGRRVRGELVGQIGDYLLPRLRQMEAPLLLVVGGSTGAGKSTLVNSLVGAVVSPAGVLRPTTRSPVLVCNPADVRWFEDDRVLPHLSRTVGGPAGPGGIEVTANESLVPGLALLDSPDVDSVVEANRDLSRQLLAAADAWLFVTTAARYADAVPWELLHAARDRGTSLCLVLNRVPGDAHEVAGHLREMLADQGVQDTELLVVAETSLADGLLPPADLAPVKAWLDRLAADAAQREGLVRRTLVGALDSIPRRVEAIERTAGEQEREAGELRGEVSAAYDAALAQVDDAMKSGSLLRGEVLARWQDVVGTGEMMRAMEARIGWLRDRVRSLVTGAPTADAELRAAVESSIDGLVHAAADRAAERAHDGWRHRPAGRALLRPGDGLDSASADLIERTRAEVRDWQGFVFELVRSEASDKRTTARLASLGVNGAGLTVMLAVFLHTGGLTGAEVAIAGGTSALSQKVLEAIFGDQAVRALAAKARQELLDRVEGLLGEEAARYERVLGPLAPEPEAAAGLRDAARELERAR